MPESKNTPPEDNAAKTNTTRLKPVGVTIVRHQDLPPAVEEDKEIHPRRPLPLVPEHRETGSPESEQGEDEK